MNAGGALARLVLVAMLMVGAVGACVGGQGSAGPCTSAFRDADPQALPPYGASPLDDAIRRCKTVADWRAAWDAVPAAHPGRNDPIEFLRDRCTDPVLAATVLCDQAAG